MIYQITQKLFFFGLLICLPLLATAQLTLEVSGMKEIKGNILIALYDSELAFMNIDQAVRREIIVVDSEQVTQTFSALPAGDYAISLFHDENSNDELDTGWFGIPKEGYGFSNDAQGRMGPPSYEAARFSLGAGEEKRVRVRLR